MDRRENYIDGVRLYSDVLEVETKAPKKKVEYYKKVEKTTTKTVIKDGNNPKSQKVVSTTIIQKDGDNPEQVSKNIYLSNYDNSGYEQNSINASSSNNYKSGYKQVSKQYEQSSKKYISSSSSNNYKNYQYAPQAVSSTNYKYNGYQNSQNIVSTNNKRNNKYAENKSSSYMRQNQGSVKNSRSHSYNQQKDKYSFSGTVKEKDNYVYYVSGIGYVNKDGKPVNQDGEENKEIKETKEKKEYKSYSVPKPIIRHERNSIVIQLTRKKREGIPVENYEYLETKEVRDHNRESLVIHRRLGDPFYQLISEKKRYSSYTSGPRGYRSNFAMNLYNYGFRDDK